MCVYVYVCVFVCVCVHVCVYVCVLGVLGCENFGDVIFGDVSKLFYGRCEMCDVIFGDILLNLKKV